VPANSYPQTENEFMPEITAKNLNSDEFSWTAVDGSKRTAVKLQTVYIGRGTYLPGWRWSEHSGGKTGKTSEAHVGYIVSGRMMVKGRDGKEVLLEPGDAFEVTSGHDAWVVGDDPCIALDFGSHTSIQPRARK
jgi:uncharacterized cupin superfamily protein